MDLTAERLIKAPPTRWRNCISAMVFGEVCLSESFWWKMFSGIQREGFSKSFEHTLLLLVLLILHRHFATQIESILDFRLVSLDFRHNRRARFLFCCRKSRIIYFNVVGIHCVFCQQWWLGRGIIKVTTECVHLCWRTETWGQVILLPKLFAQISLTNHNELSCPSEATGSQLVLKASDW